MTKDRIFEIIKKSPKVPKPPDFLQEVTFLSFEKKARLHKLAFTVADAKEVLTTVAQTNFFFPHQKSSKFKTIIEKLGIKNVRNILFLDWLLKIDSAGRYDPFHYRQLKKSWMLRAVCAHHLERVLSIQPRGDLFLQALLLNLPMIMLARAVPEIYFKLQHAASSSKRVNKKEQIAVLGGTLAEFEVEYFKPWGFPEKFVLPITMRSEVEKNPNMQSEMALPAKVICFSERLAETLLKDENALPYTRIESLYNQFFQRKPEELASSLRTILENAKQLATGFRFQELSNLSVFRVVKENKDLMKRHLIPYEEILEELLHAYRQIDVLEQEMIKIQSSDTVELLRDGITGLYNHSYFQEALAKEISQSLRYEYPMSVVILDIDDFRLFNQTYGYAMGNSILMHLGELLQKHVRQADIIARFGADEFAILLPHTGRVQAHFVAEKLRKQIAGTKFPNPFRDMHHHITISAGYGTYTPQETMISKEEFIRYIFLAMKQAFREGGNRSVGVE